MQWKFVGHNVTEGSYLLILDTTIAKLITTKAEPPLHVGRRVA